MAINPDSISQVLSLATINELVAELRKRGACYAIFQEADVLAHVQNSSEYQDKSDAEQRRIAQDMFEANEECIQDAMVRGGNEVIEELILSNVMTPELVGRRVKLITDKEVFPQGIYRAGETGVVIYADECSISVKMDNKHESLNAWNNELDWREDNFGPDVVLLDEFLAQVELI